MEKNSELTLERINEISNAINLVGDLDNLGTAGYWLGRLAQFCKEPLKVYQKERQKLLKSIQERQKPFQDELKKYKENKLSDEDKIEVQRIISEIDNLNNEFNDKHDQLLQQKEKIAIPEFTISQFRANEDIVKVQVVEEVDKNGDRKEKKIEVKIKKGQDLVPVRFYALMGEIIKNE